MSDKLPALNNLAVPALTDLMYIVTPGIDPLGSFNITVADLQAFLNAVSPSVLEVNTTPVGNAGAGTDPLMSFSVPANTLDQNNQSIYAFMEGRASAQDGGAGDTRTFAWTYGGVAIDTRVINATNALCRWRVDLWIFRLAASGANSTYYVSEWQAWNSGVDTAPIRSFEVSGLITIDHTAANTLAMTGASSDAVNDDCVQSILQIIKYPAA
jgi:hypothetical protein